LGIGLVNLIQPGRSLPPEKRDELEQRYAKGATTRIDQAKNVKPLRDLLAVMFFSLIFGAAIAASPQQCTTLVGWLEGLNAVAMVVIGWAMRLAPLGA